MYNESKGGNMMALTFAPFRAWFVTQHHSGKKGDMEKECGFSPVTVAKVWHDRFPIRSDVIDRLCEVYDLEVHEVISRKRDEGKKKPPAG